MGRLLYLSDPECQQLGLAAFVKKIGSGRKIVLVSAGQGNWRFAIPHPDGVLLSIGGKWMLNGVKEMDGPKVYPHPSVQTYPIHISRSGRLNGGPKVNTFRWEAFEGHPHGGMFRLIDGRLILVTARPMM